MNKSKHPLLGPVDWKAWEAENVKTDRRKRPLPDAHQARMQAGKRAAEQRRRDQLAAALATARAATKIAEPEAPRAAQVDVLFAVMQPGRWYASKDMSDAGRLHYGSCKAWAVKYWREGAFDRQQNPDWKPVPTGHRQEPKWLYRLTAKGEQRHRLAVTLQ